MPYIPYTDEQKQLANSVDLPTFLRMRGETLVPVGREFKLVYDLSIYPPNNKDWNEDLKEEHGVPFIPAVPHKRWEEYERQAESLQYYPCGK